VTQIDLDDDALTEAMRLSGAKTKKETVNLALREYAARRRRIAVLEHHATVAQGWDYDGWRELRKENKTPGGSAISPTRRPSGGSCATQNSAPDGVESLHTPVSYKTLLANSVAVECV
jgi:Arc/MetJ family transcription regulator